MSSRWRPWGRRSAARAETASAADPLDERLDISLRDWALRHQREIVFGNCRWMGVPIWKSPLDSWILQEIVVEVRPEVVVEIGSAEGGSTLFLAHLQDLLGTGSVVSVDVDHSRFRVEHPRIETITGSSHDARTIDAVATRARGRRTLVVHDGDHREDAVLADLEAYAPLVSAGSYLVVEDGIIDFFEAGDGIGTKEPGPSPAIARFLEAHPEFEADRSRERYLVTYNPSGYLRRKV